MDTSDEKHGDSFDATQTLKHAVHYYKHIGVSLLGLIIAARDGIQCLQSPSKKSPKPERGKNIKPRRKPGPGAPATYADAEKNEILNLYAISQANDEKRDTFIERLAREQEKPLDEVRKLLEAAERSDRRKRPK